MIFHISKLLLLYNFNSSKPALYEQLFRFWLKLERFPFMGGAFFFKYLVQVLYFGHLFRVISSENLSPYHGTLFHLRIFSDTLSGDVNPRENFS